MGSLIVGIGVDIVDVRRIDAVWKRYGARFVARLLSDHELENLLVYAPIDAARLAGRWAAKEAVSKAIGTGFRGFAMNDIEIINDALGLPTVTLRNGAELRATDIGVCKLLISISHEKEMAIAQAIALACP